mgnify:FL=1
MQTILTVLHLFLALGLIGLILIQHGRGADAGAAFGSGASATVFGARGSGSFLSRATAVMAALFFVTSMVLAYFASQVGEPGGLMTDAEDAVVIEEVAQPPASEVPVVPAPAPQPAVQGVPMPVVPGAIPQVDPTSFPVTPAPAQQTPPAQEQEAAVLAPEAQPMQEQKMQAQPIAEPAQGQNTAPAAGSEQEPKQE